MYCGNCGTRLPEWAHFCEKCGARVPAVPSDDPIERLDPDSSFVEPLWADDDAAQDVTQDDVPARSTADEMTVAMDVASTVPEASAAARPARRMHSGSGRPAAIPAMKYPV